MIYNKQNEISKSQSELKSKVLSALSELERHRDQQFLERVDPKVK